MYNQQQPPPVPIDQEIARVKLTIEGCKLELKQINTVMANERAQYQQSRGNLFFKPSRWQHDRKLKKQQPAKEQLQQKKLQLEQQLHQLKLLKTQGTTMVIPAQL